MRQKELTDFQVFGCPDCDKEFDTHRGLSVHHTKKHDGSFGKTTTIECEVCGDEREIYEGRIERGDGKYCSAKCRHEGIKTGETRECKWCYGEFYRPDCHLDRERGGENQGQFCSPECHVEWRVETGEFRGSNHPNYKGGHRVTSIVRTLLGTRSWKTVRQDYRGEKAKCEACGEATDRALDIHHIIPVASGGVHDDDLLMALCRSCHFKADRFIEQYTEPHLLKYAPNNDGGQPDGE